MKRKLYSVLLSAFALLLLMGAGPLPEVQAVIVTEEESAGSSGTALETFSEGTASDNSLPQAVSESTGLEVQQTDDVQIPADADPREDSVNEDIGPAEFDSKLLFDGVMAPNNLMKVERDGVTYVALAPTVKLFDKNAEITWYGEKQGAIVTSPTLHITAKPGQFYIIANGRYIYVEETVQVCDNRIMLPLTAIAKCFDAKVTWNPENDVVSVKRGSGSILPGDQFYDQDNLFWLSRVIYAESGNQPLEGQMSVGNVVLNRVSNPIYPNTVLGVLSQKNQFSTYRGGKLAKRVPNKSSIIAAKLVMDGATVDETEGALYFDSCHNSWAARHKDCIAVIGGHKFYR